jgi:phage terminase large subunit-like protein
LQESMRKNNAMVHITELSHGNKHKNDRVIWSLQGRFEHGNITFEENAPWAVETEDQLLNFPSKTVHDDIPDALSYIDQLTTEAVWEGWKDEEPEWQPIDEIAGF